MGPRSIGDRSSVTICGQVNSCTYLGVPRCPPAHAFSSCKILLTVDVLEDTSHRLYSGYVLDPADYVFIFIYYVGGCTFSAFLMV